MSHSGIYKIENIITHNLYIGKAKNIEHRWSQHKSIANYNNITRHLYNSMRQYGIENFTFEIIEEVPLDIYDEIINEKEKYWIKYYNAYEDKENYNYTEGGDGLSGWIPDEEWKKRMSIIKRKWYQTDKGIQTKERARQRLKNKQGLFKGHRHTEEWKQQHSLDMQGEKNPNYGKHTQGKKCLCIELNQIFESTRQAAQELNLHHQNIAAACRGVYQTSGGYHWKYID